MVCDPDIIILDEPFSGLDPVNSQILKDVISEQIAADKIVIFSSHQMSYVEEFCEDIVIINHGDVVLSGNLKEIKRDYGRNRIILNAENYAVDELEKMVREKLLSYVRVAGKKKEELILELNPNITKRELIEAVLKTDIEIDQVSSYEPSLTDIFVWKAGDEA